jgi:site-specific DNA-methyltransferase (adenine-specific)
MLPNLNQVFCGDNIDLMSSFENEVIDFIITSPPYNCNKDYGLYLDNKTWDEYWIITKTWIQHSLRLLKSGGRLAVVIPWWMGKKPRRDFPFELKKIALDCGFLFLDKILWIKGTEDNLYVNGTGWGTYMSPSGPSIRCASEIILVFSKDSRGRKVISGKGKGDCVKGDITKEEFFAWTIDTWFIRGESDKNHPAVFPIEIPTRLIKLYTFKHDIILDPFCGRGTSLLAAKKLERNYFGIDINPKYCQLARKKLEELEEKAFII